MYVGEWVFTQIVVTMSDISSSDYTPLRNASCRRRCRDIVRQNLLVICTLVGVCVGFMIGVVAGRHVRSASTLMWIGKPCHLSIIIHTFINESVY